MSPRRSPPSRCRRYRRNGSDRYRAEVSSLLPSDRLDHQISQPLGGIDGALRASGGGHCYELLRRTGKRADLGRKPIGREIVLAQAYRTTGAFQHPGIGGLILVERMRQRHEDGRPSDGGKRGLRRIAREGGEEM